MPHVHIHVIPRFLGDKPDSFHPKARRVVDSSGGLLVVGSSNLSKAALETGVEWNLIGQTSGAEPIDLALAHAFTDLWQQATPLDRIRADACRRALVAVATGLGKTWLAAFDVLAAGKLLNRQPRVLIIAHRAEILIQAEATVRSAMQSEWEEITDVRPSSAVMLNRTSRG